jgi:hypothetical protein
MTLAETSSAVLTFSAVGFAVLTAIPSVIIQLSPLDRLAQAVKGRKLLPEDLIQFHSVIVHSLSNPAALWAFAVLYLVASIFIQIYYNFPVGERVGKIGIMVALGTTIGVAAFAIVVPLMQYVYLRFAAKVLAKVR